MELHFAKKVKSGKSFGRCLLNLIKFEMFVTHPSGDRQLEFRIESQAEDINWRVINL